MQQDLSVCLFLCFGQSVQTWRVAGLLSREMSLYALLASKGVKVGIVSWGAEDDEFCEQFPNIDIIPAGNVSVLGAFAAIWRLRHTIAKYSIFKTEQMFGSWAAVFGSLLLRKPLLLRCGYEWYRFKLQEGKPAWLRWSAWLISLAAYRYADHIILTSFGDQDFVASHFLGHISAKSSVFCNFVDTDCFAPDDGIDRRGILAVGRLTEQKNYPLLIRASAILGCHVTIVGDGELRVDLQNLARDLSAPVTFVGNVPNEDLPVLYREHAIFALTSHHEGCPKALLEAMSCGCAVVATKVAGVSELVTHEKQGLLCAADDVNSLVQALQRMCEDKSLRRACGVRARRQIMGMASLDSFASRELKLYRTLCGSRA